jgi:hypothetical protein
MTKAAAGNRGGFLLFLLSVSKTLSAAGEVACQIHAAFM